MKRAALILTLLTSIFVSTSGVAWAITKGTQDNSNTYNRVAVLKDGTGVSCSGTLVGSSQRYLLTAGHCSPLNSNYKPDQTQLVCVSFDSSITDLSPASTASSDCKQSSNKWYLGRFIKSPFYSGSHDDFGVVDLSSQLQGKTFNEPQPQLPKTVGQFNTAPKLNPGAPITAVGYGDLCAKTCPNFIRDYTTPTSPMTLNLLKTDTMQLIQRNGGGTCFGDSGGPNFYGSDPQNDSKYPNLLVGVTSSGDGACKNTTVSPRLDIPTVIGNPSQQPPQGGFLYQLGLTQ